MYGYDDDHGPLATMGDAHREWHRNAGVPMGQPGCPQDACDGDYYDWEYEEAKVEWAALAPALREGEVPAPLVAFAAYGAEPVPAPDPWAGYDPPF